MLPLILRICFFIPLLFTCSIAFSTAPDSLLNKTSFNSSSAVSDSFPVHPCPENFFWQALSANPYRYDRMCSPFLFADSIPLLQAGMFRFGLDAYNPVLDIPTANLSLDTNRGVSSIKVALGSRREQMLLFDHYQRIAKNLHGGLSYRSIVSPGFLLNSFSLYREFNVFFDWDNHWLKSSLKFDYGKVEADENGGILPGQSVSGLSRSQYEGLRTFLQDDKRKLRRYQLLFDNDIPIIRFGDADSSSASKEIRFLANMNWVRWGTSYSGTADTGFYQAVYKDSALTFDSSGYFLFQLSPGFAYTFHTAADSFRVETFLQWNRVSPRLDVIRPVFEFTTACARLHWSRRSFQFNTLFKKVVAGNQFNEGDASASVTAIFLRPAGVSWLPSQIRVESGWSKLAPSLTAFDYSSNHFLWANSFEKETRVWVKPSFAWSRNRLRIFSALHAFNKLVLNDRLALPFQTTQALTLWSSGLAADFIIGKIRVVSLLRYVNVSNDLLRVPAISGLCRLSYRNRFFGKSTFTEIGSTFYGFSSYKANAFMPATASFFLGDVEELPGQVNWDLFANVDFGKATISLLMQRINYVFAASQSFVAPSYPAPPNTFKLVLNWKLFN